MRALPSLCYGSLHRLLVLKDQELAEMANQGCSDLNPLYYYHKWKRQDSKDQKELPVLVGATTREVPSLGALGQQESCPRIMAASS